MGGGSGDRAEEMMGGSHEENGEILGENYFAFLQEGAPGAVGWGGQVYGGTG